MDAGVEAAEVAKFRAMMSNGRTLPSVEVTQFIGEASGKPAELIPQVKRKKNPLAANRFAEMNAFVDVTMAGLTRVETHTWLTMFRYVDANRGTTSVSVRTVAERVGANIRHVHKAIKSLTEKGLLEQVKKGGINSGASVYRVHPTVTQ